MSNAHGNDNRGTRKFLRECGIKPTVGNVERMQREISRTQSQNEAVERAHKASGAPATQYVRRDGTRHGDVVADRKAHVRRDIDSRPRRQ